MYSFKEIATPGDTEAYFRLRRELYSRIGLTSFLRDGDAELDLDLYDLHSRFYGLYAGDELIGGIRVIVDKAILFNEQVHDLGFSLGIYDELCAAQTALRAPAHDDFPFIGYSEEARAYYERWRDDYRFCEAGRFVIRDDHRGLKLAQFVIECTTVSGMIYNGDKIGLGVTFASYPKAYKRYGYDYIGPTRHYLVNGVKLVGVVGRLCLDLSNGSSVPEHLHERFEGMAREFTTTGKMTVEL